MRDKQESEKTLAFPIRRVRAEEFYALARRFQREREHAARNVERVLRGTPRENWSALVEHPDLRTCGALERLSAIITSELPRDPQYAEAVALLAISLSEALPPNLYPRLTVAQVRSLAWNDLGKTFSFLGRYTEAFDALARAEREIEDFPTLAHEKAVIRFNVAITCQETGRHAESLTLLAECKQVFRTFEDTRLVLNVGLAEGVLLQRLRRYREARETYLLLLASTSEIQTESLAALHNAVGYCSIELGDFDDARANLAKAIALHRELRQPVQVLKGELGQGRLLIRSGLHKLGVAHLRRVRHQFLRHSLAEEAGLCGLEMIEGMLLGNSASEAGALARTIMNEFLAADLNTRAITALGYLTEAIAEQKALPRLATDVREYVLSLRTMPEREFTAPQY